jgi:hypothetical protein
MATALAKKLAAVRLQVPDQVDPLHAGLILRGEPERLADDLGAA